MDGRLHGTTPSTINWTLPYSWRNEDTNGERERDGEGSGLITARSKDQKLPQTSVLLIVLTQGNLGKPETRLTGISVGTPQVRRTKVTAEREFSEEDINPGLIFFFFFFSLLESTRLKTTEGVSFPFPFTDKFPPRYTATRDQRSHHQPWFSAYTNGIRITMDPILIFFKAHIILPPNSPEGGGVIANF